MPKKYLATTGRSDIWDNSKELFILGPWCLNEKNRDMLRGKGYGIVPDIRYSTQNIRDNVSFCRGVYELILPEISAVLNDIHGVREGEDFWGTILNPWLIYNIHTLRERYLRLKKAVEFCGEDIFTHFCAPNEHMAPQDTYELLSLKMNDDNYNLGLFSFMESDLGIKRIDEDIHIKGMFSPSGAADKNNKTRIKTFVNTLIENGQIALAGEEAVVLADMYHLTRWDRMRFWSMDRKLISLDTTLDEGSRGTFPYDAAMRGKIEFGNVGKEESFLRALKNSIKYTIPRCYVEGYKSLEQEIDNTGLSGVKAVVSATGWYLNERIKLFSAKMKKKGAKLVSVQHGGNLGFAGYHSSSVFEIENKDRYFAWGWASNEDNKVVNVPDPYLSKIRDDWKKNNSDVILFIPFNCPRYPYTLFSYPGPEGVEDYFKDQHVFLKNIPEDVRKRVHYRTYPADYGRGVAKSLSSGFPGIKWAEGQSCHLWMKKAGLVVIDYPVTSFVEALVMNVPTVLYYRSGDWEMKGWAGPYFDRLRDAGILHDGPLPACAKVAQIYKDPLEWWNEKNVQSARAGFVDKFGGSSHKWREKWLKELAKI